MEAVVIPVLVAIFASITAPLIVIFLGDRSRRIDREAEWAHQEELTGRAVKLVKDGNGKLDEIHVLVNSQMTRTLEAEHAATERELAGMLEIIELRRALGREPTPESLAAVETIRARLAGLAGTLAERRHQEIIAEQALKRRREEEE